MFLVRIRLLEVNLRSDLSLNLVDLVGPFPFIFQFAPQVKSAMKGKRDKVPDDVAFATVGKHRRRVAVYSKLKNR